MLSELHDETIKKKYKDESLEDEKKREERKKDRKGSKTEK